MNEDKATRYHRLKRRAGVLSALTAGCLQLGIVVTGGSSALREHAAGVAGSGGLPPALVPAFALVIFVACLAALHELLVLPFAFYRGFVLERRYGLSRETVRAWSVDHLKAAALGLVFGLVGAGLLYATIHLRPTGWWVPAGVVFTLTTVALVHLAPVALLPIFYRMKPLTRDALRARLEALAGRAGTRVVGVYEWQLGDRTRRANAALVGLGRTRRILVSDTLLAEYSDEEIEAVLAHELGHHVHRDIWRSVAYESAIIFAGFFAAEHVLARIGPLAGFTSQGDIAGLPIVLLTMAVVSTLQMPLANAISRHHERRADRVALALTQQPSAFVSAMRRLAAQNLAEDQPSRVVRMLFYTHPPIRERIAAASAHRGA
jgi:STE24 endopeptidase